MKAEKWLTWQEAADEIGVKICTLRKLAKDGEIFTETRSVTDNGVVRTVEMFDAEDVREVAEAFYPRPDLANYICREDAIAMLGVDERFAVDLLKAASPKRHLINGKFHVYYLTSAVSTIRDAREHACTVPEGFVDHDEVGEIFGVKRITIMKHASRAKLPHYKHPVTNRYYYPKEGLMAMKDAIEYGKKYHQKGSSHKWSR